MKDKTKVFVIINSYFIGDILLTDSLIQNIKRLYTNSKVISLTFPALVDVAKYMEGVDEVIIWDRKGKDKGWFKTLLFALKFPYKNIYACFPIYGMDRPVMLSLLLNPKYILCPKQKFLSKFRRSKYKLDYEFKTCQENVLNLLTGITKERLINEKIKYNVELDSLPDEIKLPEKYVVLAPVTSRISKDIPAETVCEIIDKMPDKNFVILGSGKDTERYSSVLKEKGYSNVIDLTNKTSIKECAYIIKNASGMISSDTGLLHLACAVDTPTCAVFYEKGTEHFIPDRSLYKCITLTENQTSDNIVKSYKELTERYLCKI